MTDAHILTDWLVTVHWMVRRGELQSGQAPFDCRRGVPDFDSRIEQKEIAGIALNVMSSI